LNKHLAFKINKIELFILLLFYCHLSVDRILLDYWQNERRNVNNPVYFHQWNKHHHLPSRIMSPMFCFCCDCQAVFWSYRRRCDNNNLSFVIVNIYLGSMSIFCFVRLDTHILLVNSISSLESTSIAVVVDKTIRNKRKKQLIRRMNINYICLCVWIILISNR